MTTAKTPKKAYETPRIEVSGKVGDLTLAHKPKTYIDASFPAGTALGDQTGS